MSVLNKLFPGRGAQTEEDGKEKGTAAESNADIVGLVAAVATLEADAKVASSELESQKQKASESEAKYSAAMTALKAVATRMAVRAFGTEGAQAEVAKATIEACGDPQALSALVEGYEKSVPAHLAQATGSGLTQDPKPASSEDRAERYKRIREAGTAANVKASPSGKTGGR